MIIIEYIANNNEQQQHQQQIRSLNMLPSNTQKKNLIQAMKKLTYQISNNAQRQKQIFDSLAAGDLIKIVHNLYDDNEYLRRISALLLCQLFYANRQLKISMTQKLCLPVAHGRICLNRIPQFVQKIPSDSKRCLNLMKSPLKKGEQDMFCWAINLDKKNIDLEYFEFKKYSSFTFLDPQRTIFGFTILDPEREHEVPLSPATQTQNLVLKTQRKQGSIQKNLVDESSKRYSITKRLQTLRPTSSIISRQKQHIPSTSREKTTYSFLKYPQQSSNIYPSPITSSAITNSSNNNMIIDNMINSQPVKNKLGTSIQSISQYARNSYGRPNEREKIKQKQRQRFSLSFNNNGQVGFNSSQIQTDRFQTKKSHQIQSSIGKIRGNSKTPQNHHQNFYKRVQQILRK